jgi:hypothetical protein
MSKAEAPKKLCFVIGPIGDPGSAPRIHADWLLQGIIQPVFDTHFRDFKVERSDQISEPGSISSQIIIRLHTAELVIADMSLANANAFYEMGIRHMKQLPTIHMYLEGQSIPFDVKLDRAISFKYGHPNDLKNAQTALKAAIDEVIKVDFIVDNPITRARGIEKLEERATPEERVLLDQMQHILKRLDALEGDRPIPLSSRSRLTPLEELMTPNIYMLRLLEEADTDEVARSIGRVLHGAHIRLHPNNLMEVTIVGVDRNRTLDVLAEIKGVSSVRTPIPNG